MSATEGMIAVPGGGVRFTRLGARRIAAGVIGARKCLREAF
jgi:hypothetical protein